MRTMIAGFRKIFEYLTFRKGASEEFTRLQLTSSLQIFLQESNELSKTILEKSLAILEQYGINLDPNGGAEIQFQNRQAIGRLNREYLRVALPLLEEIESLLMKNSELLRYVVKSGVLLMKDAHDRQDEGKVQFFKGALQTNDKSRHFLKRAETVCRTAIDDVKSRLNPEESVCL